MRHGLSFATMGCAALALCLGGLGGSAGEARAAGMVDGGPLAHEQGAFGPLMKWPIIAIHALLLPDGRVLNYGTDERGVQGAQFNYDVWDPALGDLPGAHRLLGNATTTDLFCSAQAVVPATGQVLLTGGDLTLGGIRNFSNHDINFFDYRTDVLEPAGVSMKFPRWYPTLVTLANGEMAVLGGRSDRSLSQTARIPEVYTPGVGWRVLNTAASDPAYGKGDGNGSWSYPKAWQAPNGKVFVLANGGGLFYLDPAGTGTIAQVDGLNAGTTVPYLPSAMFAPGKILSLRSGGKTVVVDINGGQPVIAPAASPTETGRFYATPTVLADGKVLLTGGSAVPNVFNGVAAHAETWNPATGLWTLGPSLGKARLYHSTALLLPDASVLVAGGGAPGPLVNLNAQIFYPPYLFKADGSGQWADRVKLDSAPGLMNWNTRYNLLVKSGRPIKRVTLVSAGSVTHTWNMNQRFLDLAVSQRSSWLVSVMSPANRNIAPPGYYLMFAFDEAGVPSLGKMVRLNTL